MTVGSSLLVKCEINRPSCSNGSASISISPNLCEDIAIAVTICLLSELKVWLFKNYSCWVLA